MNLDDKHAYRVGSHSESWSDLPADDDTLDKFIASARKRIEPWLSAVFQAEHLNLLIGSGFTTAVGYMAGANATGMGKVVFGSEFDKQIDDFAANEAARMGRGAANIEDQFRAALSVYEGLKIIDMAKAATLKSAMDVQLRGFLESLLKTEAGLISGDPAKRVIAEGAVQSFLLSFASRAASRERLHVFTTNYDRLIEHGCDLAGLRIIDRFVGALTPVFRSTRVEVDVHYNPPGIRGEPRFMEGVIRLTKLHGSLDWLFSTTDRKILRKGIPFGAPTDHTDLPKKPVDTVMIYPNPAKDVETTQYPYAELFRDFAAATCRPNAVVVTYGYGFGDDHINRVLLDMLTIPSTHLVVLAYSADDRLKGFLSRTREAQVSLLIGPHFGDLTTLIENYLPKPTLDYITGRMTELLKHRPPEHPSAPDAAAATTDEFGELLGGGTTA
ncbi:MULTISPECIES: SIR2 family protein [Alphaproteobacteria]|uniref:SIR2 family protein n=1 Tax=Alphaproteobacteria TaxID=28211 RepID=UPI001A9A1728|nr:MULTISPECIES: SIR2 family protein [Alphaproteobacteria]MCO5093370.1 SIR2 family protein [Bosea sp. (in: a-proteobacteria)]MCT8003627.1 SIR2 family protein [Sphingomonas sp. LC-1]QSZ56301.1 fibronectin-binding protein (FBP) [Rhizobium sp. ZX09]